MKFTNKIKAEEFAISESIKRWNTYFQVHEHADDIYTVGRYYEANSVSYAIKGKLMPHYCQTKRGRKKGGTNTVKNASKIIQNYNQKLKS
tara:strand:- start:639 stop:908 length:270 start_codon:yes stop_codon:yes gene_type:complete